MKHFLLSFGVIGVFAFCSAASSAVVYDQQERTDASFLLTLGRLPSPQERADFSALGAVPVSDLVRRLQEHLQSDAALNRTTAMKAFTDALGREPRAAELAMTAGTTSFTGLLQRHIQWLKDHPADYQEVIERAYQKVIRRSVYPAEKAYWKDRDIMPYILLVGCLEDWGRRNSPGLMETTGPATISVNCRFLTAVVLSPTVAAEARSALGLVSPDSPDRASASGHTLVSAGGEHIVSGGRIHFAAAGAADLVPHSGT